MIRGPKPKATLGLKVWKSHFRVNTWYCSVKWVKNTIVVLNCLKWHRPTAPIDSYAVTLISDWALYSSLHGSSCYISKLFLFNDLIEYRWRKILTDVYTQPWWGTVMWLQIGLLTYVVLESKSKLCQIDSSVKHFLANSLMGQWIYSLAVILNDRLMLYRFSSISLA